jgi:hypothetical protein
VLGWFDRWLKNQRNGAEDLPAYRAYMQEHFNPTKQNGPRQGRWVAEQDWPSPQVHDRVMCLGANGFTDTPAKGQRKVASLAHVGQAGGYFCPGMRIDNELPADQSGDDALSVCFETDPLAAPLELLGRARVRIAFTVDKPVAQLVARLCDVSPQGVSQRVSYRPLNLCHHTSHEKPEPLVPGRVYHAEIVLNECAHRLRAGHRLRLALSTSYWPIVWPTPELAAVTLQLEQCSLVLPVREVADEINPANPGPAQSFPTLDAQPLRKSEGRSERRILADGTVVLDTFDDYGKTRDPDHGLICGSHVAMHYGVHPDDPASATFQTRWNFTFERDGWRVAIDTECAMRCDTQNFYLTRKLRATEGANETEVLTREWSETIPRGLL